MIRIERRGFLRGAAALAVMGSGAVARPVRAAAPVLRLGYGTAAAEQLWLLIARPELGKNRGRLYELEATPFPSSSALAQALEANAVDIASGGANGVIFAAAAGVAGKMIASVARESRNGFNTPFFVKADLPIRTVPDLRGKVIGINGFYTSGHLWLLAALHKHGMTDKDVDIAPSPMPAMGESLRSGVIDAGMFAQPFAAIVEKSQGVRTVFDSKYGVPFDEELIVLVAKDSFLKAHAEAVRAFLQDLKGTTEFYLSRPREARQMLIDAKMVRVSPDIYLDMKDYWREPSCRINIESVAKMQDLQVAVGMQEKQVDVNGLVDLTYLG